MNASAPNLFWLGFQLSERMYDRPAFEKAGQPFCVVATAIAVRTTRIVSPANSATSLNTLSAAAPRPDSVRASSRVCMVAPATYVLLRRDLAELRDRLLRQLRREGGVTH